MMNELDEMRIWYDEEGNRLTVTWGFKPGYYTGTDDDRVTVRVDLDGNVQGFQVESLGTLGDQDVLVKRRKKWTEILGKDRTGSRPRCILLTDGDRKEVADKLTGLIGIPDVVVSPDDEWMPCGKPFKKDSVAWDDTPAKELRSQNLPRLLPFAPQRREDLREQLLTWWLVNRKGANTLNLDIASSCEIAGEPGLLIVEAKAHAEELKELDKCGSGNPENRERIGQAIAEAKGGLSEATEGRWNLSLDSHYQISNRFAWAWKLASLGVPVVLLYLGFLEARDMVGQKLFRSLDDWDDAVKKHGEGVVDNTCWGRWLDVSGTPMLPLVRVYEQPLQV